MNLPDKWLRFDQLKYTRPDMAELSDSFRRCRLRLRLSMSAHASADAVLELQPALLRYYTAQAYARNCHDRDLRDLFWQQEAEFFDEAHTQVQAWTTQTYAALATSRFAADLQKVLGDGILREAVRMTSTVNDRVIADLSEENRLESAYVQRVSQLRAQIGQRSFSLTELGPLLESADQEVRRISHQALCQAWEDDHDWFDACFSQLVSTRSRVSRKMGYSSFTEMAYKRMSRVGYGRGEVELFRGYVIKYIVPVCSEIRRLQRNRLGLMSLYHFDLPCLLPGGNPQPLPRRQEWVSIISRHVSEMLEEPRWLSSLEEYGYIDLEARHDKAGGGYCETLYEYGLPVILTNATGTADDVVTLVHETGHAYASLASLPQMRVFEDQQPAMDVCEIHSTALEYLMMTELEDVFGDDTETAAMVHLIDSILFLPYACLVDHFQHEIYDKPTMSAMERHNLWRMLERLYQPDIDYDTDEWFEKGGSWQKKEHIFTAPFYYIDYALAHIAALDLWQLSRKDRQKAVRRYKKLCRRGNHGALLQQLEESGIASPFAEGTFKRLIYAVCDYLEL